MKRVLAATIIWLTVMLLLLGIVYSYTWLDEQWRTPLVEEPVVFEIKPGTSMQAISEELHALNPQIPPRLIELTAKLTGRATRMQAGVYEIPAQARIDDVLKQIARGEVITRTIRIPEGLTVAEVLDRIAGHEHIEQTLDPLNEEAVIAALDAEVEALEGWLYPDTYQISVNTTDIALIRRAYRRMQQTLDALWAQRADEQQLQSPYDALILASIIEKETAVAYERPKVSGVFHNRLRIGMRLQTDPTVIYGMGEDFPGVLTRRHLQIDTPHNTYTRDGLPPTPIALPSRASLQAALNPEPTDALYFVADGSGGHAFSRTLEEHNRAVARWRAFQREQNSNQEP